MKKSSVSRVIQKYEKDHGFINVSKKVKVDSEKLLFGENNQFEIRVADSCLLKEESYRLTYKAYLEKGFIKSNKSKMCFSKYDMKDSAVTLVVLENQKVVGTLTLLFDVDGDLPGNRIYEQELNNLRQEKIRLAELVSFAVDQKVRGAIEIIAKLFNVAYILSTEIIPTDNFIITVNPRHIFFYIKKLSFELLGDTKPCPKVSGAPANLLSLSLSIPEKMIHQFHVQKIKTKSIYDLFLSPEEQTLVIPTIKNQLSEKHILFASTKKISEESGMFELV